MSKLAAFGLLFPLPVATLAAGLLFPPLLLLIPVEMIAGVMGLVEKVRHG